VREVHLVVAVLEGVGEAQRVEALVRKAVAEDRVLVVRDVEARAYPTLAESAALKGRVNGRLEAVVEEAVRLDLRGCERERGVRC